VTGSIRDERIAGTVADSMGTFIVVSGLPGSGKTTLARAIASDLELPLLSKDTVKEALFDTLGVGDVEWSKRLGSASVAILFGLAREMPGCVLESFWDPTFAKAELQKLDGLLVELHCSCSPETARQRFQERHRRDRHPGHLDDHRIDDFDTWIATGRGEALRLGGPLLEVSTEIEVDPQPIVQWVRKQLS
jgi:hypothetical protein